MKGLIYVIKNNVNEKVYIGKTYNNLTTRYNEHIRDSRKKRCEDRALYSAIKKYGENSFFIELLEDGIEEALLEEREIYYINKYNSYKNGYNCSLGGDGKRYITWTDAQVLKIYSKHKSIRKAAKELQISIDTVSMILHKNNIEIIHPNSKKILILELNKTFDSIIECAKFLISGGKSKTKDTNSVAINIKRSIKRNTKYLGYTYVIEPYT
jgi:hypothetical protein